MTHLSHHLKKIILSFASIFLIHAAQAGTLLVTNVLANTVTFYNEATLQAVKVLSVGFMPHEVAVTPNGKLALVSNFGDLLNVFPGNTLTLIDVQHGVVLQTIQLEKNSRPHGIKFISDTEALVTAQGLPAILVVDITKRKVIQKIPLSSYGAHMIITDAKLNYAYVASMGTGTVYKIDLKDFAVIKAVNIGQDAEGIALTPDENTLLVTDRVDNAVAVINAKNLTVTKKIATNSGPVRISITNHGASAVVINSVGGTAQILDLASLNITKTFSTTSSFSLLPVPINMLLKNEETAYITNSFDCSFTLVDIVKGNVLKTVPAYYMPDGIAFSRITINA